MVYIATAQEVEYARQVAANAAATNLAYQQNKLPVLPKYAQTREDTTRVYIGGDANTQGTPMDLTRSQYIETYGRTPEESESIKYQKAISEPRNPYHSAAELALVREYEQQRGMIVTGSSTYAARGELQLSDPSEEMSGPVYSGRAAEYKSAWEREVYGVGAPDSEQEYYRREAERAAIERPGYTAPADLGDISTQQMRQGYAAFGQAMGLQGIDIATDYQMTGKFIEMQRQAAYETPTRRDERFFMGELQKWAEIPVEKASAYHDIGMESGKAIPANPYEYQADLAVEFLKGSPDKASEFFSPVSGEMSRQMPGGIGVQEFAWNEAITDYKRQTGAAETPYPEQVSFMQGVTYLGAAEGKYGPYGKLAGGVDTGGVGGKVITTTTQIGEPFFKTEFRKSEGSGYDLYRAVRAAIPPNPLTDIIAEGGIWAGAVTPMTRGISGVPEMVTNIQRNLFLDTAKDKSYAGAIAHAQAHETGFFSPEQTIIGDVGTNKLLSIQRGGFGFTSATLPNVPAGTKLGVSHTHPEPFPFLNLIPGGYFSTASPTDVSQLSAERRAGVVESSVITRGSVLTYQLPGSGATESAFKIYKSESTGWPQGLFGLKEESQKAFFKSVGASFRTEQMYRPSGAGVGSGENAVVVFGKSEGSTQPSRTQVGVGLEQPLPPGTTVTIKPQTLEFPIIGGKIPVASDVFSFFTPEQIITTKTTRTKVPDTITQKEPYTVGDTTYFETITESGEQINVEESVTYGQTPFTKQFQKGAIAPSDVAAVDEQTKMIFGAASAVNPLFLPIKQQYEQFLWVEQGLESKEYESARKSVGEVLPSDVLGGTISVQKTVAVAIPPLALAYGGAKAFSETKPEDIKLASGFVPGTPEYWRDTYKGLYEDPARAGVSAAITTALVGVGTGTRALGLGEGLLAPATKSGRFYQGASTVASSLLVSMYASDVSKRVTGSSLSDLFPVGKGIKVSESGDVGIEKTDYFVDIQKRFPGVAEARKQLNVVETQELIPMSFAYAGASSIGDSVVGWARTRSVPQIKTPEASGYMASEGFPTNPSIKTQDLIDSFNIGAITLRSGKIGETKMAPYGTPIQRIPVGTQIGVPKGQSYIYTGSEYPFLNVGYVGESKSELPALFTSPQRISYFTKAGQGQMGGFGITNDLLGIYRLPSVYRSVVKAGVYQEIPGKLLSMKNPVDPLTGKPYSINDPLNPRNVAIGEWMRTTAKPGVPVISQYGKSEWQYLIPAGSGVKSQKMTGWYYEDGIRIPQYDVTYTGKRAPRYKPPEQMVHPITKKPMRPIGKFYEGMPSSSVSSGSRRNVPFIIPSTTPRTPDVKSTISTRMPSVTPVVSSPFTSGYPSSYKPSQSSFKSPSSSGVSKSTISSPFTSKYPSSYRTPSSSKISESSISSPSTSKYPSSYKTPSSSKSISEITTTPFVTTTVTPTKTSSIDKYTRTTPWSHTETTTTKIPIGGFLPGGGGYAPIGNLGVTRWQRENLVATAEYLGRGMRSISWGMDIGSGTYSEKTRMTKKRKTTRRKKK